LTNAYTYDRVFRDVGGGVKELSEGFVKVAESKDVEPSRSMKTVDVAGEKVCIINIEENYYAIGNICTHAGGPQDKRTLEGYEVKCPWHGSKFDVRTGEPTKPLARQAVPKYESGYRIIHTSKKGESH
jgi:nitrite reductase/ring-hydroxylating ferredoxin subunit